MRVPPEFRESGGAAAQPPQGKQGRPQPRVVSVNRTLPSPHQKSCWRLSSKRSLGADGGQEAARGHSVAAFAVGRRLSARRHKKAGWWEQIHRSVPGRLAHSACLVASRGTGGRTLRDQRLR